MPLKVRYPYHLILAVHVHHPDADIYRRYSCAVIILVSLPPPEAWSLRDIPESFDASFNKPIILSVSLAINPGSNVP